MKKTISGFASVIMITGAMFYFSSCSKDESIAPADGSQSLNEDVGARHFCQSVFPPNARVYGHTYAQWSAKWWKWSMEFPMTGHPFIDDPSFQVSARQSGPVWFLAAPFGTVVRNVTIPHGKTIFVGLLNAEASDLEGLGTTAADQRANAKFNADHIINLACSIDGNAVNHITSFRFSSPQLSFTAPTPWIFGATGGAGTSVGDGYFVMLLPLSHGHHVLHYTGSFHFSVAEGDPFDYDADLDMTYNLNVQ